MKKRSNMQSSNSLLTGMTSALINSQNECISSRVLSQNSKRDLTVSNSTANLSSAVQLSQLQQQCQQSSQQQQQQGSSTQRPTKYFMNNNSNTNHTSNTISTSLDKKNNGIQNYFFKNGTTNSLSQQYYFQQQLQNQQKSFDSLQRSTKNESNPPHLQVTQNKIKSSRSIINYTLPESNSHKQTNSYRGFSPLNINQHDQVHSFLGSNHANQENIQNFKTNSSKSPQSIKNSVLASLNNNSNSNNNNNNNQKSSAPLNKLLTPNINISNIFKSSNSNHLHLSNAVKKNNNNNSLSNLNNSSSGVTANNKSASYLNNENKYKPLNSLFNGDNQNQGIFQQKMNSQKPTQRTERTLTSYDESNPKKNKIVENIIENILNTEESVQESNIQISLYEENRNLQNIQKKLTAELETMKCNNTFLSKENQELKEAIKAEREKFKEELTKQLLEISNLKKYEEMLKNEKNNNDNYIKNLQILEDSFVHYKNDLVGLIYDTFEIVLTIKGFNTHLKSISASQEEVNQVNKQFLSGIVKKSSDLINKLNPFVMDLNIEVQLKEFGSRICNEQKSAFYQSLQSFHERNRNQQLINQKNNSIKDKINIIQCNEEQQQQEEDFQIIQKDFEEEEEIAINAQQQNDSQYKHGQSELTNLKSLLTSTMSNLYNNSQQQNENNSLKIKSMALELRSNQEISCQYSQDQYSIQSQKHLHKNSHLQSQQQLQQYSQSQQQQQLSKQSQQSQMKQQQQQQQLLQQSQSQQQQQQQQQQIQEQSQQYIQQQQQQQNGIAKIQDYISFNTNDMNDNDQIKNIIQNELTPSKQNQIIQDQFQLITSNYKPIDYEIDLLKEDIEQDQVQNNIIVDKQQYHNEIVDQQDLIIKPDNLKNQNNISISNYNLPKQIPIQPKNFILQLVSPSSDSSHRTNIFEQSKLLNDSRSNLNASRDNNKINNNKQSSNQNQNNILTQSSSSNNLNNNTKSENLSIPKNVNILSSLKSQTETNLKTINNTMMMNNQKGVNNSNNIETKLEKKPSNDINQEQDGSQSSSQNTVIYHHSKQVSQLSQNNQSSNKSFLQNLSNPIIDDKTNCGFQQQKDKEIMALELSPCFSSSRFNDLDNSHCTNPLENHKKSSSLIQIYHPNTNHKQQMDVNNFISDINQSDNIFFDNSESPAKLDYIDESLENNKDINITKNDNNQQLSQKIPSVKESNPQTQIDNQQQQQQQIQQQQQDPSNMFENSMSGDEYVIAEFNFKAQKENDLEFNKGDKIQVLKRTQNGWWIGLCRNRIGYFPYNFVSEIKFS